jgi:4-amino-4-deoxy-L-arabinose transferase-like glycosyltransferase
LTQLSREPITQDSSTEEPLVPPGNPLRPRALVYVVLGVVALIVLMASDTHLGLSVPLGLLAALLASFGALDFTGCFDDTGEPVRTQCTVGELAPRLLELGVITLLWVLSLRAAVAGYLPGHHWLAPLLVTLTSLAGVVSAARLVARLSGTSSERPLRTRGALWLMLTGVGLYVPWLGSYSLLDPWETHYGEVAREMLARDDWLSLWWAQDGWFWSKPVLDFWLQGLSFSLLGVDFRPDRLLASVADGALPQPEWAARLPVVLFSLLAVQLLYRLVAACAGRRAAWLSGMALLCVPYWSLLSHQSMTDMPYVAPLTAAMAAFGLGLLSDPEERAPALELSCFGRKLRLSAFHLLFCLVLLTALPQLAYLVSRNLTLQVAAPPYGFRWHLDELFAGSGLGNCGLPGNEGCRPMPPLNQLFQPVLGALIFGAALGYLLHLNRGERRQKRLWFLAAWYFTALSALAKGAPGLVLALAIAGAALVARRDWQELTRVELAGFCLMFAAVCLPWYVQSYMRHGEAFSERLLTHDMYKRAFVHVHDTNTGSDVSLGYYLWQLGYGLFPWTGLCLIGLGLGFQQTRTNDAPRRLLASLMALWLTVAFALFTLSLTKFHHYALPCAPPLAIGAGLALDRALGEQALPRGRRVVFYLVGLGGSALLLVFGMMRLRPGNALGDVPVTRELTPASAVEAGAILALGVLLAGFTVWRRGEPARPARDTVLGVLGVSAALLTLLVTRDLSTTIASDVPASARLLHLITYNYKRAWPASLDFEAVQWAFGMVAAGCALLLTSRLRHHAAVLAVAVGAWFCAFTLWVYLPRLAPHFGQRELFLAYYAARRGPEEPIVAYQMNWKGENFYTGNRLPAFVSSGDKFKGWISRQRKRGTKELFFVTEHARIGALKVELGSGARVVTLTDKRLNNKFALVSAQLAPEPAAESPPE